MLIEHVCEEWITNDRYDIPINFVLVLYHIYIRHSSSLIQHLIVEKGPIVGLFNGYIKLAGELL